MVTPRSKTYTTPSGQLLGTGRFSTGGSAPPPPAPSITLSSTGNPVAGVEYSVTVTAANLTGALVVTPANLTGTATFNPSTATPAPGELVKLFGATWDAAGAASIRATAPGGVVSNTLSVTVAPAPSPTPPPPPPAPAPVAASGGTASASLASATGSTSEAVAFGMALREGAFPSSSGITVAGLDSHQVQIRNAWPDGSAKYVVVAGRCTIPAGSAITATLSRGTAATGTALTESDLLASGVDAVLQYGGGPLMTLSALIGVAAVSDSTGLTTNGRVRQLVSGPQMSSWLYACRLSTTNVHLIGWMEVRYFGGTKVHVLPWVENGFTRLSGCAGQAGTLFFSLGGVTRYNVASVHLANHCRVVAQDVAGVGYWNGTAPDVYAAPDPGYMQRTGLVPTYSADTSAATARLNGLAQSYSPTNYGQLLASPRDSGGRGTNNGDFDPGMSDGGYHAGIGPIPEWDVHYLTSGADQRAWKAVIANAMGYGRYGVHFRDETTLRPVNPADVVNKTLSQTGAVAYASGGTSRSVYGISDVGANQYGDSEKLPAAAGYDMGDGSYLLPEVWAQTHHPSAGFMAYLLTGQEFFLELNQFVAGTCFLRQNNLSRNYGSGYQLTHVETTRGAAWALRSIFQAATISVDGTAIQTGFAGIAQNNIASYLANYVTSPCGSFGATRPYSNFNTNPAVAQYRVNGWELDFSVCAWGYGLKMKPPVGATPLVNMASFFTWHAQWVVHRLGALSNAATYGFNAAARGNSICTAPSYTDAPWVGNVGPWYATPGEVFQDTHAASNSTNGTNTIGAFDSNNGTFPDATSYWGNMQSALAFAVEHGVAGAWDGYLRMVRASNWSGFDTSTNTYPVWSQRSVLSPPAWAGDITTDQFSTISGTQFFSWASSNVTGGPFRGNDPFGSVVDAFNDPAFDPDSLKMHFYGGGHGDGSVNGVYTCDLKTFGYSTAVAATPASVYLPGYMVSAPNVNLYYPSGVQFNGPNYSSWFLTAAEGLNATTDAGYIAPQVARVITHQYAAAAVRRGVVHYFYLAYGEADTVRGTWAGRGTDLGAQLLTYRPQYNAVPLQQGTVAVYDDVTDRFFVSLVPGDAGGGWRSGVLVFNPNTRTIDAVLETNESLFGLFLGANQAVRVGRKIYWFLSSAAAQSTVDRGFTMDMDIAATKTGLQSMTESYCQKFTLSGDAAWSTFSGAQQETIPAYYDGTAIKRWNYVTAHRSYLINVNLTPASGLGTVASPYVLTQTRTALGGTVPADPVKFVYSRLVYLPSARAAVCIPSARADWFALRVS